jgi:dipeptidyl aminopeptidase/acylaminoacyl peptidase
MNLAVLLVLAGLTSAGKPAPSALPTPAASPAPSAAPRPAPISEPLRLLWQDGVKNAYPRWSRDGARILFQSNRTGRWQIDVMNRDGSGQTQLTSGEANNNFPDWSPDNRSIAFVSDRDGNEEVYVMAADGGGARNLSRSPAQDIHPYWTPDGGHIVFASRRGGGRFGLFAMRADGTEARRITTPPDGEQDARPSVSPDRSRILFNRDRGETIGIFVVEIAPDWWSAPPGRA